jgi:predicted nucleic-acid-binding Zn-ribbon protein
MREQESVRYHCPKCGASKFKTGHIYATEEDNSSFFDIPGMKFYSVICKRCGYTDLYEAGTCEVWNFRNLPENE